MKNPAERLVERLIKVAHEQIEAAKEMDPIRLEEATTLRRDLLFELELERDSKNVIVTSRLEELAAELSSLDERLMALLTTVNNAMEGVKKTLPIKTYGANGRMKR